VLLAVEAAGIQFIGTQIGAGRMAGTPLAPAALPCRRRQAADGRDPGAGFS